MHSLKLGRHKYKQKSTKNNTKSIKHSFYLSSLGHNLILIRASPFNQKGFLSPSLFLTGFAKLFSHGMAEESICNCDSVLILLTSELISQYIYKYLMHFRPSS